MVKGGIPVETVLFGLTTTLEKHGHGKLYKKILELVVSDLNRELKKEETTVTVAKESDLAKLKGDIEEVLKNFDSNATYESKTDDSIIGGYIVKKGSTVVDGSYKHKLLSLYRTLTK